MNEVYRQAIGYILEFKKKIGLLYPQIANKLAGDLGEFYVLWELDKRGFNPTRKCGHSGCDIVLSDGTRIEVRTSLLKNEGIYPKGINFYGWRVKNRDQKIDDKFDILVAVALDETFTKPKYYIFSRKEAFSVDDVLIPRFKNVQKKIAIYENKTSLKEAILTRPKLVTRYEKYINKNRQKYLNQWKKIKL